MQPRELYFRQIGGSVEVGLSAPAPLAALSLGVSLMVSVSGQLRDEWSKLKHIEHRC